jgi:hypothetical protein
MRTNTRARARAQESAGQQQVATSIATPVLCLSVSVSLCVAQLQAAHLLQDVLGALEAWADEVLQLRVALLFHECLARLLRLGVDARTLGKHNL